MLHYLFSIYSIQTMFSIFTLHIEQKICSNILLSCYASTLAVHKVQLDYKYCKYGHSLHTSRRCPLPPYYFCDSISGIPIFIFIYLYNNLNSKLLLNSKKYSDVYIHFTFANWFYFWHEVFGKMCLMFVSVTLICGIFQYLLHHPCTLCHPVKNFETKIIKKDMFFFL